MIELLPRPQAELDFKHGHDSMIFTIQFSTLIVLNLLNFLGNTSGCFIRKMNCF